MLLPVAVACLTAWALAADAAGLTLERLLPRLALEQEARTFAFTERRESGLLSEPLVLHGELTLRREGSLVKRTRGEDGREAVVRIQGETVTVRDAEGTRRFRLSRSATLAALVGAMRALLRGDAAALRSDFDVTVSGDAGAWRLELERTAARTGETDSVLPGNGGVTVTVAGGGDRLRRIVLDGDGQRVTLELEPTASRP